MLTPNMLRKKERDVLTHLLALRDPHALELDKSIEPDDQFYGPSEISDQLGSGRVSNWISPILRTLVLLGYVEWRNGEYRAKPAAPVWNALAARGDVYHGGE